MALADPIRVIGPSDLDAAARLIRAGGLLAYPTEAVYGLGCDPFNAAAVVRLLRLKRRSPAQGFLLVGASEEQLNAFVDWSALSPRQLDDVRSTWPGPVTWILPRKADAPAVVMGAHEGVAARVTAHEATAALCRTFGAAIVSTSANLSGCEPARTVADVQRQFVGSDLDGIFVGPLGGLGRPTEIRHARTGAVLRPGDQPA